MKLKCPHCRWKMTFSKAGDANDLVMHIFVVHWHNIQRKIKKQEQKRLRAETKRELEKEKKRKRKRDQR